MFEKISSGVSLMETICTGLTAIFFLTVLWSRIESGRKTDPPSFFKRYELLLSTLFVAVMGSALAVYLGLTQIRDLLVRDMLQKEGVHTTTAITTRRESGKYGREKWIEVTFELPNGGPDEKIQAAIRISENLYENLAVGDSVEILYARTHPQVVCLVEECKALNFNLVPGISAGIVILMSWGWIMFSRHRHTS